MTTTTKKEKIIELVRNTHKTTLQVFENEKWNENDLFDFACWLFNSYVNVLALLDIIPLDELQQRISHKMQQNINTLFENIKQEDKIAN